MSTPTSQIPWDLMMPQSSYMGKAVFRVGVSMHMADMFQLHSERSARRSRHCNMDSNYGHSHMAHCVHSSMVHDTTASCVLHGAARVHFPAFEREAGSLSSGLLRGAVLPHRYSTYFDHRKHVCLFDENPARSRWPSDCPTRFDKQIRAKVDTLDFCGC